MRIILATVLAILAFPAADSDAKEYNVSVQSASSLAASCKKAGGKFTDGQYSYYCSFKTGNVKECSKRNGNCIITTPDRTAGPGNQGQAAPVTGAVLDPGPGQPNNMLLQECQGCAIEGLQRFEAR